MTTKSKKRMTREACSGCYNNDYNHGLGGAKECWSFKDAKIVMKRKIHVDQIPPYKQKPQPYPNCYQQRRYVFWE